MSSGVRKLNFPFQRSTVDVLTFLQELLDKNLLFSTFKVHLTGITAFHVGFNRVMPDAYCAISEGSPQVKPCN